MGVARVVAHVTTKVVAPSLLVQRILRFCRDQAGLSTDRIGACRAAHDKEVFIGGAIRKGCRMNRSLTPGLCRDPYLCWKKPTLPESGERLLGAAGREQAGRDRGRPLRRPSALLVPDERVHVALVVGDVLQGATERAGGRVVPAPRPRARRQG